MISNHRQHQNAIEHVKQTLEKLGVDYKISGRTDLESFKDFDLVLTLGGDGTILRTAQHVHKQLILGVNTVPNISVGALCSIKIQQFTEAMTRLVQGQYHIDSVHRMDVRVNGKMLSHKPINDVLFTNISPAGTSHYLIKANGKNEEHKSSGLWISTPAGSTAAILAAGGKKQKLTESRLQFLVREPYQGIYNPYKLTHGFVTSRQKLRLTSKMIRSKLYFDGPTSSYPVEYGDQIDVELSKDRVRFVRV